MKALATFVLCLSTSVFAVNNVVLPVTTTASHRIRLQSEIILGESTSTREYACLQTCAGVGSHPDCSWGNAFYSGTCTETISSPGAGWMSDSESDVNVTFYVIGSAPADEKAKVSLNGQSLYVTMLGEANHRAFQVQEDLKLERIFGRALLRLSGQVNVHLISQELLRSDLQTRELALNGSILSFKNAKDSISTLTPRTHITIARHSKGIFADRRETYYQGNLPGRASREDVSVDIAKLAKKKLKRGNYSLYIQRNYTGYSGLDYHKPSIEQHQRIQFQITKDGGKPQNVVFNDVVAK